MSLRRKIFLAVGISWAALAIATQAFANHTVIVEGQSDFDGDGFIGPDEDADGDQVFGTINGGLSGVGFNGRVVIVTSGEFNEGATITPNGFVALEAAPGVSAVIEAFKAPNDATNAPLNEIRQTVPGIQVLGDGSFPVEIRNIITRNWSVGILIGENARVTLDNVSAESNADVGILVADSASALISNSRAISNGFRNSGTPGFDVPAEIPANPGAGILFHGTSSGVLVNTKVANNLGPGVSRAPGVKVKQKNVIKFNNGRP